MKGGEAYDCLEKFLVCVLVCVSRCGFVCAMAGFFYQRRGFMNRKSYTGLMIEENLMDFSEKRKTFKGRLYHV